MLTDEQKFENQTKFMSLLTKLNIDLTQLSKYLLAVNYFEAPASAQYEYSYPGGLCERALKLAHELGYLCSAYFPEKYTEEDILKVALFKDIFKAELYEFYYKNVKNETTGQWEQVGAYRNKENRQTFGDIGFSSYMIAKNFINFTDEQIEAIIQSNGLNNYTIDIHEILKNFKLAALTKMAEMAVSFLN